MNAKFRRPSVYCTFTLTEFYEYHYLLTDGFLLSILCNSNAQTFQIPLTMDRRDTLGLRQGLTWITQTSEPLATANLPRFAKITDSSNTMIARVSIRMGFESPSLCGSANAICKSIQ